MSVDLAEFLLARIAEDEVEARTRLHHAQQNDLIVRDPKYLGMFMPGWWEWRQIEAFAARVLAECEAKRRIVIRCQEMQTAAVSMAVHLANRTLADLASPFADHPDYRQE